MTLTVGEDKISRLTLAGNEFVNAEDVWLPCGLGEGFTGTPILMHYDPDTKTTFFIGQVDSKAITQADLPWSSELLTLPAGFHFTGVDENMPVFFDGTKQNQVQMPLSSDGRNLSGSLPKWVWALDVKSIIVTLSFGHIREVSTYGSSSFWQTTTVAPD